MNNFQQTAYPYRAPQPQVQGSVYILNSPSEMDSIPISTGYAVGLVLQENILLLKHFQNGIPTISTYDLIYREKDGKSELTQIKEDIEAIKALLIEKGGLKDYV